jgi:tol-pal system protein YbgF
VRALQYTFWILAVAAVARLLAPMPTEAANKDTELILAELRQLQAQVSQLQRAQSEIERLVNLLASRSEGDSVRQILVNTQTTLEDVKENISVLSSRLDETNARIGNLRHEVTSLRQRQQPLMLSADGATPAEGAETTQASGGESTSESPVVAAAAPSPSDLYNQAYADYNQARYPLAISGFEEVIRSYPTSELADNAQYWIGECYLARRQFRDALQAFETVLRKYPDSNKLAEASFKKAQAFEGLGRRDDAIMQLEYVIEQYPRTQVEASARLLLKRLRSYQQ